MTSLPDELQQFIHAAVDESVNSAMTRQRSQHPRFVPGTIVAVSGPIAKVIPDDALVEPEDPEQFVEAVRLDWYQGVHGGVIGDRGRTIIMTIPGGGVYCLGAIPSPGEASDVATDPQSFFRRLANDSARAAGVATDMTITADLTEGYLYGIHFHGRIIWSASGPNAMILDQDGVIIGRLAHHSDDLVDVVDSWIVFEAAEDLESSVFTVENAAGSNGTLTVVGSSEEPRTFMALCIGPTLRAVVDT